MNKLKVVCISDTHLSEPELPEGDLLIHAGDSLNYGSAEEWKKFVSFMAKQTGKFKRVVYVPGNHDKFVQQFSLLCKTDMRMNADADLLIDEMIDYADLDVAVYGSPWVPYINGLTRPPI